MNIKQVLPKDIEIFLDSSLMFNKFGLVNIKILKSKFNSILGDDVLKQLIQDRFGDEFKDGIEFIEE